jgi:hypothetical protein
VERARATWTDERLDDLAQRMDDGFNRVDAGLRSLRTDMNARFDAVNARFDAVNARFDALHRAALQFGGAMIAAFVAGFLGLIATQL